MAKTNILWLEDDPSVVDSMRPLLVDHGVSVDVVTSSASAQQKLSGSSAGNYDAVLLDMRISDGDGLDLLEITTARGIPTAILTGYASVDTTVRAFKMGARDVLTKPVTDEAVLTFLENCSGPRTAQQPQPRVVGTGKRMNEVMKLVQAVADTPVCVLITGESGTGKSLIARQLAAQSERTNGPFIEVSCGALNESLLESELFGHVRGAFTGADNDYAGKIAAADGGTIFLDEIGTASPRLQVKLLRFLQDHTYEAVGSNRTVHSSARVVLATNEDLHERVREGTFREDLYYRINVINVDMPPLRHRRDDLESLAHFLLTEANRTLGKSINGYTPAALEKLKAHSWPGNIRELKNVIERAVLLAPTDTIGMEQLFVDQRSVDRGNHQRTQGMPLKEALQTPEREFIREALGRANGNRGATARDLGINRATLYKKMKRLALWTAASADSPA